RSKEADRADRAASRLAALIRSVLPRGADLLGPAECPIGIIAGNHRRQILLRGPSMGLLHGAARIALGRYEKGKDSRVYLETDVDPVSLL
ncbi:MAG: primosomal protein N', partial [Treponema sp.]|nr:primosomal protein N' [Treponema sp.]